MHAIEHFNEANATHLWAMQSGFQNSLQLIGNWLYTILCVLKWNK